MRFATGSGASSGGTGTTGLPTEHDVRTPLHSLLGLLELLGSTDLDGEQRQLFGDLTQAAAELRGCVEQLAAATAPPSDGPAVDGPGAPATDPGAVVLRPLRLLLAEDNAVNRLLAERQLRKLGHQLHTVTGGREAVEEVQRGGYDVVLMDCQMPDVDGLAATRQIRAAEQASGRSAVPIIAVTADVMPGHREQCLAAGMSDFLSKPLDLDRLAAALAPWARPLLDEREGDDGQIDLDALGKLVRSLDDDAPAVAAIVGTYLTELPARRVRLSAASRAGAVVPLLTAARSLRMSSEVVGALELGRLCAEVESLAAGGDRSGSTSALEALTRECARVERALSPYRDPDQLRKVVAV